MDKEELTWRSALFIVRARRTNGPSPPRYLGYVTEGRSHPAVNRRLSTQFSPLTACDLDFDWLLCDGVKHLCVVCPLLHSKPGSGVHLAVHEITGLYLIFLKMVNPTISLLDYYDTLF